ncbi:MAG: 23S rRNA (pseudouridine(1915)-N(3))-methyltransferase RlmH [Helicobacteraceae bacterium]|jgi:23S rRNA (pseudouridine1915-N3)-methyltransferase|nr:23S rRNA (pseudouridine(1915)-N(3))-methyltransferase RlmH [Helicobacteraceae bacterium]
MTIDICFIGKGGSELFAEAEKRYLKLSAPHAKISLLPVWNVVIDKAQKIGAAQAREAYSQAFASSSLSLASRLSPKNLPRLSPASIAAQSSRYLIALSEEGELYNSFDFAKLVANRAAFSFYIGGAYGLDRAFCGLCDRVISLSPLTFSHEIARIVLLEQLYRAFTIESKHPYHK